MRRRRELAASLCVACAALARARLASAEKFLERNPQDAEKEAPNKAARIKSKSNAIAYLLAIALQLLSATKAPKVRQNNAKTRQNATKSRRSFAAFVAN